MAGDGDNTDANKSITAKVEQDGKNLTSPYSLFASDNPGALITSVMFTGDNYNE